MTTFIKIIPVLCLALLSSLAEGRSRALTGPPQTIFNVLQYGAKPDGNTDATEAFHAAWTAACQFNGDAMLVIPSGTFILGQVVFAGPCKSPTPLTIQMTGTLKATVDTSQYKDAEWVAFERIDGLIINGGGTFDGQGEFVWGNHQCSESAKCGSRAVNLKFRHITNATINKITSLNPKGFHMCVNNCQNFKAEEIQISAPGDSPNTDGIHISSSTDVEISKSIINTGDDCISIIQGDTRISITDVTCGPGHGISVGSLGRYKNEKDVNDIFVKNCTLSNTTNGVRIKTWRGSPPSAATNINFEDIIMDNVHNPIIIDQEYCSSKDSCGGNEASKVKVSHVTFRNIRGTSVTQSAVKMKCSSEFPCENVQLFDINLKYTGNAHNALPGSAVSECSNIKVATGGIQLPPPCL